VAAAATLGLVVGLGIFPATPRYLVPVGGMVIGNSMTITLARRNFFTPAQQLREPPEP
jgi:ABC-type iron transport system FetAB permease component